MNSDQSHTQLCVHIIIRCTYAYCDRFQVREHAPSLPMYVPTFDSPFHSESSLTQALPWCHMQNRLHTHVSKVICVVATNIVIMKTISEGHLWFFIKIYTHETNPLYGTCTCVLLHDSVYVMWRCVLTCTISRWRQLIVRSIADPQLFLLDHLLDIAPVGAMRGEKIFVYWMGMR